jgi:hypothetical protein
VAPRLSVSQITTLRSTFAEDVRDIEIFSDDGTFGAEYPDSIWAASALETLRAQEAFEHCWSGPPSAASRRLTVKESR